MTVQEELAMLSSLREYVSSCICEDPSLKEELIKDPKSFILARLTDLDESDLKDIDFKVVDEPSGSIILPIPTVPEDMDLDELESVAGGFIFTAKAITAGIKAASKAATAAAKTPAGTVAIGTASGVAAGQANDAIRDARNNE